MASALVLDDDVPTQAVDEPAAPTWGDYGTVVKHGTQQLGSSLHSAARYLADQFGDEDLAEFHGAGASRLGRAAEGTLGELSPTTRDRLTSSVVDAKFWSHPFSSTALKLTDMSPSIIAAAIPGGVFGTVVGATVGAGAIGGVLGVGDMVDEFYKGVDKASDKDLQEQSDIYRGLRSRFDEKEARRQFNNTMLGMRPALQFALSAATNAIGPSGMAGRALAREAGVIGGQGMGLGRRVLTGALEGGATEGIEETAQSLNTQSSLADAGLKKNVDLGEALAQGLDAGAMGLVAGAPGGIPSGAHTKLKTKTEKPAEATPTGQQPKGYGTGNVAPPPNTIPNTGDEAFRTAVGETVEPETVEPETAKSDTGVEVVPAKGADAAQAVALAANDDNQVKGRPDPAAEAANRVTAQVPPPAPAPQVTPEVTPRLLENQPAQEPAGEPLIGFGVDVPQPQTPTVAPSQGLAQPIEKTTQTGRILPSLTPEAKAAAAQGKAAFKALNKNAKDVIKAELPPEPAKSHKSKAEQTAKVDQATAAKGVFEQHTGDNSMEPAALNKRLGAALTAAKEAGITIPAKISDTTPDHIVWLREAKDLHTRLKKKEYPLTVQGKEHINNFIANEITARGGDFSIMRGERKAAGEAAKHVAQGDVETIATPDGQTTLPDETVAEEGTTVDTEVASATQVVHREESQDREAVVSKSRSGVGSLFDEERAEKVAPVRKIEITPEMRAKYETKSAPKAEKQVQKPDTKVTPAVKAVQERAEKSTKSEQKQPAPKPVTPKQKIAAAAKEVNTTPSDAQKEAGNYTKEALGDIEAPNETVSRNIHAIADEVEKLQPLEGKYTDWTKKQIVREVSTLRNVANAIRDGNEKFLDRALYRPNQPLDKLLVEDIFDPETYNRVKELADKYDKQLDAIEEPSDALGAASVLKEAVTTDALRVGGPRLRLRTDLPVVTPSYTMKAREVLKQLDFSGLTTVPKAFAEFFQKKMLELAADVNVYVMSPENMAKYQGTNVNDAPAGTHSFDTEGNQFVVLNSAHLRDPRKAAHVVLHELAHAATTRLLYEDKHTYNLVAKMMREVQEGVRHVPELAKHLDYAMTNPLEFIAEAFSNQNVQHILSQLPASERLRTELNMSDKAPTTLWRVLAGVVRRAIEKVVGKIPQGDTMMEAVLRLGEQFENSRIEDNARTRAGQVEPLKIAPEVSQHLSMLELERSTKQVASDDIEKFFSDNLTGIQNELRETVTDIIDRARVKEGSEGKPWALKWRTLDNIAQVADNYFGDNNPVRKVANIIERIGHKADVYFKQAEPTIEKLYNAQRKHSPEQWNAFVDLLHDETMTSVFADRTLAGNTHLGKDTLKGAWAKGKYNDLHARWKALPDDLKVLRYETLMFFTEQQNKQSLGLLRNVMNTLGHSDEALIQRAFTERLTEDDIKLLGKDVVKAIDDVGELKRIVGPYVPLMRRGSHVVLGHYKITPPKDAKVLAPNEFEFSGDKARDRAMAFAANQDLRTTVKSVWVDKKTGETHYTDLDPDAVGEKVLKEDDDAEQRFRVRVQDEHVEFFDSERAADKAAVQYQADGLFRDNPSVQVRKWEPTGGEAMSDAGTVKALHDAMVKRDGFRNLTQAQKSELEMALKHAALRLQGSTKIQSKRLPRRYVAGASHDLVRNALDYSISTGNYLAKLDHRPELDAAMKQMRDSVGQHDKRDLGRSAIAREVEDRVLNNNGIGSKTNPYVQRALSLSFIDKLMSPSYSVINSLQPVLLSAPVLAGRHGVTRAVTGLSRAYSDIAALKVVGGGASGTYAKLKSQSAKTANFIDDIKARIKSADERRMIDQLVEVNAINPEAGFELGRLIQQKGGVGGKIDVGLGYLEGISRQMPKAVEAINRTATALAAYRLERARGATHDAAVRYAQDTVNNTQFNYSATNAPPIINHPLARLFFQFKKYSAGIYQLLGMQIGKAIKNERPGDRKEALKTLAGIMATHTAVAGTLGLPTEAFKLLFAGISLVGGPGWDDVEDAERRLVSKAFGAKAGEVITRGAPRLLGIDVSSRTGLDSLLTFGGPRSEKDADIKSYLFDMFGGPVVSLGFDYYKGAKALASGNVTEAAEKLIPMKFAADSIRAYRRATEGKKTESGRTLSQPYGYGEMGARALGFTPAREAEEGAKAASFKRQSGELRTKRDGLINTWIKAKPSDKTSAWAAIQQFNRSQPTDAKITIKEMQSRMKRNSTEGLVTNKKNKHLKDDLDRVYSQ